MNNTTFSCAVAAAAWFGLGAAPVQAGTIEVIYTEIPGHPTAQAPGIPGAEFTSFLSLYGSPSGSHWVFKAFVNAASEANDVIMVGSGTEGIAVAREGDPAPIEGLTYGFMDSDCGINDDGRYVFGNRLAGGSTETDEILFLFNGVELVPAVREGEPAPDLVDPMGAGDELFGNSLNSAHVLNDGRVSFRADLIQNIDSDYESALYRGTDVVAQEGTSSGSSPAGDFIYDSFIALSGNTYSSDAGGLNWIVEADIMPGLGSVQAVVVNGQAEITESIAIPGMDSPVDDVFAVDMLGHGTWLARGDNVDGIDWAVANGIVLAATGDPVTPGADEHFSDAATSATFLYVAGNAAGDLILGGGTDNPDPDLDHVIVLNGETIVVREGDPVDLDGDGLENDDAFIRTFGANDVFLSDTRVLYFFVTLRNSAGESLGDAFLRLALGIPADVNGDGVVDILDLLAVLGAWGPCGGCPEDIDGNGVVDILDLLAVLANWS